MALRSGATSASDLLTAATRRMGATRHLNAFIGGVLPRAIERAEASDERRRSRARSASRANASSSSFPRVENETKRDDARHGATTTSNDVPSLLDGVPIAVKDNFFVPGAPTTAGSNALRDFVAPLRRADPLACAQCCDAPGVAWALVAPGPLYLRCAYVAFSFLMGFGAEDPHTILKLRLAHADGTLAVAGEPTKTAGQNPGWLLVPPGSGSAFVGMEDEAGSVQAYAIDPDDPSKLSEVGERVSSVGQHPCSLAIDASGKWLLVRQSSAPALCREAGSAKTPSAGRLLNPADCVFMLLSFT